jgi:ankyrin repeat protein
MSRTTEGRGDDALSTRTIQECVRSARKARPRNLRPLQLLLAEARRRHAAAVILGQTERSLFPLFAYVNTAIGANRLWAVRMFIDEGLPLELDGEDGENFLFSAVRANSIRMLHAFMADGLQFERNAEGDTLLHAAAMDSSVVMMRELLALGFAVDALNAHSASPAHYAAALNNLPILRELQKAGADFQIRAASGSTVWQCCTTGDVWAFREASGF